MRKSLLKNCPQEWNVRVLTQDDFYSYCDATGIQLHEEMQLEQQGLYIVYGGKPHIFIDERLRGPDRLFVQFHEVSPALSLIILPALPGGLFYLTPYDPPCDKESAFNNPSGN